ncbi:MAG: PQQ-binding-like beta-propeller repeat protein [Holophagales bacterium]|nr:PQQ-binding-like beta-propeller repeat protein [Holophagales bacterium]MYJ26902.1 PQQ-binding-like beta-propeller repeat protein [Holophagales bacterium]
MTSWRTGREPRMAGRLTVALACVASILVAATELRADDWPEFRGKGRLGVWHETGIVEEFPAEGLKALWRTPIKAGFAGPAVADGRVFITDFEATHGMRGTERALALDEATGRILWTREWKADYAGIQWETGPGATPTVDGDRVYTLGRTGVLSAFDVETGALLWRKDYAEDYGVDRLQWGFDWGFASAPLVDGPRLICFVGGPENARVVAFDKMTGEELWRALDSEADLGVAQPIIVEAGGARQLIVWNPEEVVSLDPTNGEFYWRQPYTVGGAMTVATPVQVGSQLFFTTFYDGPLMLTLDQDRPGATVAWKGSSNSEIQTDGLHAVLATPIIEGGTIYGICSYGQLRGLNAETGERLWETQEATGERRRWVSGFLVRNGDRVFINNDRGDLIIARLSPAGYEEISRTHLITPTSRPGNRRELRYVSWVHPAYANKHVYIRNDEEMISLSLDRADYE